MQQATICFCVRDKEVLLGKKKIGFGVGKWNGFGGKVDPGETNEEAAARELFEEAGIATEPASLIKVADVQFYFATKPKFHCHAYIANTWHGEPHESAEMAPQWFPIEALPLAHMWPSDTLWVPHVFRGERIRGTVWFDADGKTVERSAIEPASF